jgi:hypothetical protein
LRDDAAVAALEGRSNAEICFCEAQTISEISPEAARFGTIEDSRPEQPDVVLFPENV